MACLLVLVVAAAALTVPPGKLTHAARTPTSPEAFWRAALPDAPMPESIRELLRRPSSEVAKAPSADADVRGDDPPPPMNFNYDDYRTSPSSPRYQLVVATTSAKAPEHVDDDGARASASPPPAVFFLEDAVRVGGSLPFARGLIPRAAPGDDDEAAPADPTVLLEMYAVRAVRAVEGSSFVVCRGEARSDGRGGAVYGCRGVGPARAYAVDVAGERGDPVAATVVCHADDDDDVSNNGNLEHAASRLLGVKPGGAAVCYAVPDAQILLVKKSEKVPSSA